MSELDDVPRMPIGKWPTPIRSLERVSDALGCEVWAKLEEDCGAWGGNKVRKLEHILHAARRDRIDTLVVWGAATSNWASAAALHGSEAGFTVVAGLGGKIPREYAELYRRTGTRVVRAPRIELAPVAAAAARVIAGRGARLLPVGGSGGIGDVGAARTGFEIGEAIATGRLPRPRRLFVPLGTCGTAAGVIVGLGLAGNDSTVVAVKVTDWPYATRAQLDRRVAALEATLERMGIAPRGRAPFVFEDRFIGPGYGAPTEEAAEATAIARRDGLELDGTYAAKAFAALAAAARASRDGPFLFLHTSPGPVGR